MTTAPHRTDLCGALLRTGPCQFNGPRFTDQRLVYGVTTPCLPGR
jgi:hypothetical protein